MDKNKFTRLLFAFLLIVYIGASFNIIALVNNDGFMPVLLTPEDEISIVYAVQISNKHFSYYNTNSVNYWFLTDIIRMEYGCCMRIVSIGDILITIGAIGFIFIFLKQLITKLIRYLVYRDSKNPL